MINPKVKAAIVIAIAIMPLGLVVLGLWKSYELIKEKNDESTEDK